jgi:hypothetical protein
MPRPFPGDVFIRPALESKLRRSSRQFRAIPSLRSSYTRDACIRLIVKKISGVKILRMKDIDSESSFAFAAVSNKRITIWIANQRVIKKKLDDSGFAWLRKNLTVEVTDAIALNGVRRHAVNYRFINIKSNHGIPICTTDEEEYPLNWSDICPGETSPQLKIESRTVVDYIDQIEVRHVYTGFRGTDTHIYNLRLNSISRSVLKQINLHGTFPNIVQHSHRVLHDKSTAFIRDLDDHDLNTAKRAFEYNGGAVGKACHLCRSRYAGYYSETLCAKCDATLEKQRSRY